MVSLDAALSQIKRKIGNTPIDITAKIDIDKLTQKQDEKFKRRLAGRTTEGRLI